MHQTVNHKNDKSPCEKMQGENSVKISLSSRSPRQTKLALMILTINQLLFQMVLLTSPEKKLPLAKNILIQKPDISYQKRF